MNDRLLPEPEDAPDPARAARRPVDRRARRRDDRGAVIVEAAVIAPIFFLLLFAILEFGIAMRSYLALSNAVRDGAREAAVEANEGDADYNAVNLISSAGAVIPDGNIDRIVVYHADGPDGEPSAGCKAGTPSAVHGQECNVYGAGDFGRDIADFGCDPLVPSPDRFWCPADREVSRAGPPDWVGVWIQIQHPWVTGLFGSDLTMTDNMVMRIEPRST